MAGDGAEELVELLPPEFTREVTWMRSQTSAKLSPEALEH